MSIDPNDLGGEVQQDFRRANGAPMVSDPDNPDKNQRYSRPSGWGKQLDDENALVNWKIRTAMRGVANSEALQAKVLAAKDGDKKAMKEYQEEAIQSGRGNEASDTGTALHAMSVRVEDPDDDFEVPRKYKKSLEAYLYGLNEWKLVSERFEYHLVCDEYRAAGTADRLYRTTKPMVVPTGEILPAGTLFVGDLKTGKTLDFSLPGYCVQMAIYAQGQFYDVESNKRMPTPDINQDWGILVHMPAQQPGFCEFLFVDLATGNHGAWLVQEVKNWRKRKDFAGELKLAPIAEAFPDSEVLVAPIDNLDDGPQRIPDDKERSDDDAWITEMSSFVKARMKAVGTNPEAKKSMLLAWPEGLPTPKQGIERPEQMTTILRLLDDVEAKHEMTFPVDDPRSTPGAHQSNGPVSNEKEETT